MQKALFISDIHLGAKYIEEPRKHEDRICCFLKEIGAGASDIFLLGDILDYWFEYKNVVPQGYIRFFGTLASLADSGVNITWLTGNHDIWLFDYLRNEIGINVIDKPYITKVINGQKFILSHGDRIGGEGIGFKLICKFFRNRICQRLYAAIHPRWTIPFAHRWSNGSRKNHSSSNDSDDSVIRKYILSNSLDVLRENPDTEYIIMGHHHIVMDQRLPGSSTRVIVLGDWIDKFTYAVFDGQNLRLHKYHS